MADEYGTLRLAAAALLDLLPDVYLERQQLPDPPPERLVLLDLVAATSRPTYGRSDLTTKRVQVTCYAQTRQDVLRLNEDARRAMLGVGFSFIQQRPALDPDTYGEISEYRQ